MGGRWGRDMAGYYQVTVSKDPMWVKRAEIECVPRVHITRRVRGTKPIVQCGSAVAFPSSFWRSGLEWTGWVARVKERCVSRWMRTKMI